MRAISLLATAMLALAASTVASHAEYVCRLNPYGDNFLSLRAGPGGSYDELMRMGSNTALDVLGSRGPWLRVQTARGEVGWAHSSYICRGYPR